MDMTPNLSLAFLLPNQAQKHVTLNDGLKRLDVLVQLSVVSAVADPPVSPAPGARYIVPEGTGAAAWESAVPGAVAGRLVSYADGAWTLITPRPGWLAWEEDGARLLVYGAEGWTPLQTDFSEGLGQLGINGAADTVNRLVVKSDAELLSHDDVTPGSGDARKVINKAATDRTASLLFQDDFEGRAELGLTGDDDLHFKVSDGAVWREGVIVRSDTGRVECPHGMAHHVSGMAQLGLVLLAGGDGLVSIYRIDTARPQNPRSYVIASVSGEQVTLTTASSGEIFNNALMEDVSYLRIWNVSHAPPKPAWVRQAAGASIISVLSSNMLAGWLAGDVIEVGDPLGVTGGRCIALDISPMLSRTCGAVFRQSGLLVKLAAGGAAGNDVQLDMSPDGSPGSFIGVRSAAGGVAAAGQVILASSVASPISNSNLVFIREQDAGGNLGVTLVSVAGVFV